FTCASSITVSRTRPGSMNEPTARASWRRRRSTKRPRTNSRRTMRSLDGAKIVVTGGSGFLGSHVVEKLRARGARDFFVPRSAEFDLTDPERTRVLFDRTEPDLVIHLAARVGGIGANRRHPGTFFYANMAMGVNVLEQARRSGTPKVVVAGTICAYPK